MRNKAYDISRMFETNSTGNFPCDKRIFVIFSHFVEIAFEMD